MKRVSSRRPLVTVLITAYNEAECIEGAVRSVLDQTYDNLEAVVVNDGSTDGTADVLNQRFEDERLRVFDQDRRGRVLSLNRGLDLAKGTFVAVLDADDRCSPRRIERQVDYLSAHEGIGVVGSQYIRKDSVRDEEYVRKYPSTDGLIRKEMAKYIPIAHSCAMYRKRAVVDAGGYDEKLTDHEDLDLWIRLAQNWKFANIPEPLVVRHIRSESYWHRNFSRHTRNVHLAKLNARSVTELHLPWYYYVFPVLRVLYTGLPTQLKRLARRFLSEIEEVNVIERNEDAENLPFER
jgi:glycosyltransferase involved in cell wall biosynthesis